MGCGAQKAPEPPPQPPPGPPHPKAPKRWKGTPVGPCYDVDGAGWQAVNGVYKPLPSNGDKPSYAIEDSDMVIRWAVDNVTRQEKWENGAAWVISEKGAHRYLAPPEAPTPPEKGWKSAQAPNIGGGAPLPIVKFYPPSTEPPEPDPQGPKIVVSGAGAPVNGIFFFRDLLVVDESPKAACAGKERWEKVKGEGGYCIIYWIDCEFTRHQGFTDGSGAWVIFHNYKVRYIAPGAGDLPPTEGWQVVEFWGTEPAPTIAVGRWPDGTLGEDAQVERNLPKYWKNSRIIFDERLPVDPEFTTQLQKVLDATFKRSRNGKAKLTRDSKGRRAPTDFKIVAVQRVEDSKMWEKYRRGQEMIRNRRPEGCKGVNELDDAPDTGFVKTMQALDAKYAKRLDPSINEFYLFHGSSPEGALGISDSGFMIDKAGSNAGTMFGRGAYFAEACTKADEYAREGSGLSAGIFALLFCRVTCGEMFWTVKPDLQAIEERRAVLSCDSVLGDREAAVNTYREFVIFEENVIYPEYVILYQRIYDDAHACEGAEESDIEDDGFVERPGQ